MTFEDKAEIVIKQLREDRDRLQNTIEQIRAEIQENINYNKRMNYQGIVAGLLLTLDIIDKYREESEEQTE